MSKNASLPRIREAAGPASGMGNNFRESSRRNSSQSNIGIFNEDEENYNPYESQNRVSGHGGDNLFQATKNFGGRESENIRNRNEQRLKSLEDDYG